MSSLRARTIRLAFAQPELRPSLLPLIQSTNEAAPDRFITVGNPAWRDEAEAARQATLAAGHPCRCLGPTVTILDHGLGPIMDVNYGHDIIPEQIEMMDRAVSRLGWRGWGYGTRGIAFKPRSVRLARSLRVISET